jgi:hypothetical protein
VVVAQIGLGAGDNAVAEAKDSRMELWGYALHQDAASALSQDRGTCDIQRRLDEPDHGYVLASVGRRNAPGGAVRRKAPR